MFLSYILHYEAIEYLENKKGGNNEKFILSQN